jgi:CoA:oxalate CoA-transferase
VRAPPRQRDVADWVAALEPVGIPATPINSVDRALDDPQVDALELVRAVEHPTAGPIRLPGPFVQYDDAPPPIRRPPPLLAEHTDAVLHDWLALDDATIARLRTDGAIQ